MPLTILLTFFLLMLCFAIGFMKFAPQLGQDAKGKRLKKVQASANFKSGAFQNPVETTLSIPPGKMAKVFWEMQVNGRKNEPDRVIDNVPFDKAAFMDNPVETIICWLGHSSLLIKINGLVLLVDPVFSKRASTFSFLGPKQFDYSHGMSVEQLPPIDAVIISHDHYDHLDYGTILNLRDKVPRFYTALGVGAHLERWGIAEENITEMDWWESAVLSAGLTLTATPNRHFSGRGFARNKTLWCSFVLEGKHKLFLGADSGYYSGFKTIGEKYGPFDLTLLECGAYNELWESIHMLPEQTAQANIDLKGKVLMPIHWGKFNLSLHHWTEPIERLEVSAEALGIRVVSPKPHQLIRLDQALPQEKWWKEYGD